MVFIESPFPSETRSAGGARREKPFPSGKVSSGREKRQPEMISHSASPEVGEGLPLRGGMGCYRGGVVVWGVCKGVCGLARR